MAPDTNELEFIGQQIHRKLEKIRKDIAAPLGDFSPADTMIIDVRGGVINDFAIKHPNQPIKIEDEYCFAYIKDHNFHEYDDYVTKISKHPIRCFVGGNKVHFYNCTTLINMANSGREARYCAMFEKINLRPIDLHGKSNEHTRLAWCKHCIKILGKNARISRFRILQGKNSIAEYGNATDIGHCVELYDKGEQNASDKIRDLFQRLNRNN